MRRRTLAPLLLAGLFWAGRPVQGQSLAVAITSPVNGDHFAACSSIPVTADVQVTGGDVQNVQFYRSGILAANDTRAPYEYSWASVPPGVYVLTARANGKQGGTAVSEPVIITVGDTPDGNILANGDFSCALWPWTFNIWEANARAAFSLDTTTGLANGAAAVIDVTVPGSANWTIQLQNPVAIEAGRDYQLAFWARSTPPKTIEVTFQENKDPFSVYFQTLVTVGEDNFYGPFTFECETDDPNAYLRFNVGGEVGKFVLDQVELIDPSVTGVRNPERDPRASDFVLGQNFPNPFNSSTVIEYRVPSASAVTVDLFDMKGNRVRTLSRGFQAAGTHRIAWDGRDDGGEGLPSGVYAYRIVARSAGKSGSWTRKLLLLN
jgi:hypothetical protein